MAKYHLIYRPPMYGTIPDGFSQYKEIYPSRDTELTGGLIRPTFGWVEYADPLPFEKIFSYELLPDDPVERARFRLWNYADRDTEKAAVLLRYFEGRSLKQLEQDAEYDTVAEWVYVIRKAEILHTSGQLERAIKSLNSGKSEA